MSRSLPKRVVPRESSVDAVALATPVGLLDLELGAGGIQKLSFREREWDGRSEVARAASEPVADSALLAAVVRELGAYFRGDFGALDRIPVAAAGTPFQQRVWSVLRTVPAGATVSYLELAQRSGSPKAVRAVAACNARNPVAIVVPCHRVIGSDGSLTGYGGGLPRKRWLLDHEGPGRSLLTSPSVLFF